MKIRSGAGAGGAAEGGEEVREEVMMVGAAADEIDGAVETSRAATGSVFDEGEAVTDSGTSEGRVLTGSAFTICPSLGNEGNSAGSSFGRSGRFPG